MAIEVSIKGLENLDNATGELGRWGKKPFSGKASLRIKKLWATENLKTFKSKGKSIGEKWKPLSPDYATWKKKNFPSRPLLVLRGDLRESVTKTNSKLMIFNNKNVRQLIIGTRVPYASVHNYGRKKKPRIPMRKFIKVNQKLVNSWAKELGKDAELAMKGSKRWQGR